MTDAVASKVAFVASPAPAARQTPAENGPQTDSKRPPLDMQRAAPAPVAEAKPQVQPAPATRLSVALDSETGTFIYRSVNETDGEVVWQWPSEQVMRVIQYFRRIESLEDRIAAKPKLDEKA
jgi:hypothetical protein